jgi:bifunctional non-homologous end joining protein LigD
MIHAALLLKCVDDLKLPAFLKATGSRGLHIVVPLYPEQNFGSVHAFARRVAASLAAHDPDQYTLE